MASFRQRDGVWFVRYMDEHGKQKEKKSGKDKSTAKALARKLEDEVAKVKAGLLVRPKHDSLTNALESYLSEMKAKAVGETHIYQARLYIGRVIKDGGIKKVADLDKAHILKGLAPIKERGLAPRTYNLHLILIKTFAAWCGLNVKELNKFLLNEAEDLRRVRRVLTPDEKLKLLESVRTAKVREKLTGEERRLAYAFAMNTGLRVSEIASLRKESFDLPYVNVEARSTKDGLGARQPLPDWLVSELEPFLETVPAGGKVFKLSVRNMARVVKADCVDAGIDPKGVDFHSFRGVYCTVLSHQMHPVMLKQLARHKDIKTTLKHYVHLDAQLALETVNASLPSLCPALILGETGRELSEADGSPDSTQTLTDVVLDADCRVLSETVATPMRVSHLHTSMIRPAGLRGSVSGASGPGPRRPAPTCG